MAKTLFKGVNYSVSLLIEQIDNGTIGLPDIQRPFVWNSTQVRDLFDSMYRGFPVGNLLFWSTLEDPGSRMIGVDGHHRVPQSFIIDGQQRLTSLFAVMRNKPVIDKNFQPQHIRIAFRPHDGHFEVANATTDNDPEYLPDISVLWSGQVGALRVTQNFLTRLTERRELSPQEEDRLAEALDQLKDLQGYPFNVVELSSSASEEEVADVFVRINSKGVQLNQAAFILTLMSVWWDQGRADLEDFARSAKQGMADKDSPFNHFIQPDPDQLLRVAVAYGFRRARLQYVYSLLRGKDLTTGKVSEQIRDQQFLRLKEAQAAVLDLGNWHEFLGCLTRAGFRSGKMITSQTTVLYAYALWLLGRYDYQVEPERLRNLIARWFFMTHTIGRYSNSPESGFDHDLGRLRDRSTADGFCELLDEIITESFTTDYWAITLPSSDLATSANKSPGLSAYFAALVLLDTRALFSNAKVAEVLDPVLTHQHKADRGRLFPKEYLMTLGKDERSANQIANMALAEWDLGVAKRGTAPAQYWPRYVERTDPALLEEMRGRHALPLGWELMGYEQFLTARRKLMAQVVREGFESLRHPGRRKKPGMASSIPELIAEGETERVEFKAVARSNEFMTTKMVIAIAGLANKYGGTLLIGVEDDRTVRGIADEYPPGKPGGRDGYQLWVLQTVANRVSQFAKSLLKVDFASLDGREVCAVRVSSSPDPLFTKTGKGGYEEFYVRMNASTQRLSGDDMVKYQKDHW